jgi:UDP-GlcNAc:undecaprenyl-phosphate GlcNAc-1-phosphate transferase
MIWLKLYGGIFLAASVMSLISTPLCRILAFRFNFLDRPLSQGHKTHRQPIPLLGGLAICSAWVGTILLGVLAIRSVPIAQLHSELQRNLSGVTSVTPEIAVICVGAILSMLLGLWDDRFNMSAKVKFFGQFLIATIVVVWGKVHVSLFVDHPVFVTVVSVFWILVIFNAINFFDNMDGLAVGTAAITFAFFTIAAAANQQYYVASFCAAAAGACVGFWFFNHSPATIFMGDSGSHFLGYLLAVSGAKVTFYNPDISTTKFPILIPLFILAIPLFDLASVVVIRTLAGKPFYIGDNNHISHRFVRMGMSRKRAVFLVHLLTLLIGLSVLPLLWGDERTTIVSLVQAATILALVTFMQRLEKETA